MDAEKDQDGVDGAKLGRIADEVAERVGNALDGMLGTRFAISSQGVSALLAAQVAEKDEPIVVAFCRAGGEACIPIQVLLPRALGAVLAGRKLGQTLDEIDVSGAAALDSESLGCVRDVLRDVLTCLQEALSPELEGDFQVQDALEVEEPASDPTWLDGKYFSRLRFGVELEGMGPTSLDVLFPGSEAPESVEVCAEPSKRVLVLDDEPDSIDVDALGRVLGSSVEACDLEGLRELGTAELASSDAILIPWEIAGAPGIEIVERLAAQAKGVGTALVVVHPEPTRSMVISSLHAGATSFVLEIADFAEQAADDSQRQRDENAEREQAPS